MNSRNETNDPVETQNVLSVSCRGKGIPYGGLPHADGQVNHGFKPLKGNTAAVASVPEAAADRHLQKMLERVNDSASAFWSVGCVSSLFHENPDRTGRIYYSGYVEFAFNDDVLFCDPTSYFQLFIQFESEYRSSMSELGTSLNWELAPATAIQQKSEGWTCATFLRTRIFPESAQSDADEAWGRSLEILAKFLTDRPTQLIGNPLF